MKKSPHSKEKQKRKRGGLEMKVCGLQGNIMRLSRLKDKLIDKPEVAFRLAQLKRFERLRDEHGLTASDAAHILGISRATLYRWRQR
ncbi:MAG: DUF134 domain-containing protein [Gammaproteobacteria bacterium]|nr:MAG: DUF134 domain-containing protein [Gammaproteobacteria bacterium]